MIKVCYILYKSHRSYQRIYGFFGWVTSLTAKVTSHVSELNLWRSRSLKYTRRVAFGSSHVITIYLKLHMCSSHIVGYASHVDGNDHQTWSRLSSNGNWHCNPLQVMLMSKGVIFCEMIQIMFQHDITLMRVMSVTEKSIPRDSNLNILLRPSAAREESKVWSLKKH